jgi:hypothetical protein
VAGVLEETDSHRAVAVRLYNARGQMLIESKEDARKRGIKSPDRAEAIILAFADPRGSDLSAPGEHSRESGNRLNGSVERWGTNRVDRNAQRWLLVLTLVAQMNVDFETAIAGGLLRLDGIAVERPN